MKFEFRRFSRDDYEEYRRWFDNKELRQVLEGIDEEWLNYILKDEQGIELAILEGERLVCVIGISYPEKSERSYVITNIAVNPTEKNKGLGSEILMELLRRVDLKPNEYWISYVEKSNKNGRRFFEKNGWEKIGKDEDNLIRYEFHLGT